MRPRVDAAPAADIPNEVQLERAPDETTNGRIQNNTTHHHVMSSEWTVERGGGSRASSRPASGSLHMSASFSQPIPAAHVAAASARGPRGGGGYESDENDSLDDEDMQRVLQADSRRAPPPQQQQAATAKRCVAVSVWRFRASLARFCILNPIAQMFIFLLLVRLHTHEFPRSKPAAAKPNPMLSAKPPIANLKPGARNLTLAGARSSQPQQPPTGSPTRGGKAAAPSARSHRSPVAVASQQQQQHRSPQQQREPQFTAADMRDDHDSSDDDRPPTDVLPPYANQMHNVRANSHWHALLAYPFFL